MKEAAESKSMLLTNSFKSRAENRALRTSLKRKYTASPIDPEDEDEIEEKPMNYKFAVFERRLLWINYEQKRVWEFDLGKIFENRNLNPGLSQVGGEAQTPEADMKLSMTKCQIRDVSNIQWNFFPCKSFTASAIFQGMSA